MHKKIIMLFTLISYFSIAQASTKGEERIEEMKVIFTNSSMGQLSRYNPSAITWAHSIELLESFKLRQEAMALRQFLNGQQMTSLGTAKRQVIGFPMEALVFYSAIGATMFRKDYTDSLVHDGSSDPRWMENFSHEISSPVGLFSFFCFVVVSGQTNWLYSAKGGLTLLGRPFNLHTKDPVKVTTRLTNMKVNALRGGKVAKVRHFGQRVGLSTVTSLGGQLGMAMGMMASNIVHEVHYMLSYNPHFKECYKEIKKAESEKLSMANKYLNCDQFWSQSGHTVVTWLPGIFSLITASIIAHKIVGGAIAGVNATYRLTSQLTITKSITKAVSATTWFVPVGFKLKIATVAGKVLSSKFVTVFKRYGLTFLNLYTFMEVDALLTHKAADWLFMEDINLKPIGKGLKTFEQNRIKDFNDYYSNNLNQHHTEDKKLSYKDICTDPNNVNDPNCNDRYKGVFICSEEDPSDCKYYDSIKAAHKVSSDFSQWRQYKMQLAQMAYINWVKYVSNAVSAFETVEQIYKTLISHREKGGDSLYQYSFFGEHDVTENIKKILKDINDYLNKKGYDENSIIEKEQDLNFNFISSSPYNFLKSDRELKELNNRSCMFCEESRDIDKLLVLRKMFSVIDPNEVPDNELRFFYDDWQSVLMTEIETLENTYINTLLRQPEDDLAGVTVKEWINNSENSSENSLEYSNYIQAFAINNLRLKVLATGFEYLKNIVSEKTDFEKTKGVKSRPRPGVDIYEELESSMSDTIAPELFAAYHFLGSENIFTKLYENTFIENTPITSYPMGMQFIRNSNKFFKEKEKASELNIHPDKLKVFRTTGLIDFILASAVCGADLNEELDPNLLRRANNVLNQANFEQQKIAFTQELKPDVMDEIPIFDNSIMGTDYHFYPPRITQMDENDRREVCSPLAQQNSVYNIVGDMYNSYYKVGDKEYTSLLPLVLDHIDGISLESFDQMWKEQVMPLKRLFLLMADMEYENIVKNWFVKSFFQRTNEAVNINSKWLDQSQNMSLLDDTVSLSQSWFSEKNSNSSRRRPRDKEYSLEVPEGLFQNMQLEMLYWSDIILFYSQKQLDDGVLQNCNYVEDDNKPCVNIVELKSKLKEIANQFDDSYCMYKNFKNSSDGRSLEELSSEEMYESCRKWAKGFINNSQDIFTILTTHISESMNLDMSYLGVLSPEEKNNQSIDEIVNSVQPNTFIRDAAVLGNSYVPLPEQMINFSIIRVYHLIEEALRYAHQIGSISSNPEVNTTPKEEAKSSLF